MFQICCLHPRTHCCLFFFLGPPENFGVSISIQSEKENSYGNLKSWGNKGTKGGNSIHRAQLLPTGWNQRGDTAAVRDATGSRDKRGRNARRLPPLTLDTRSGPGCHRQIYPEATLPDSLGVEATGVNGEMQSRAAEG